MPSAARHLTEYARYHRDRRNIATHFVGIPLIVFGVAGLLARLAIPGLPGAHWLAWLLASAWYLRQGRGAVPLLTIAAVAALVALAQPLGQATLRTWAAAALGSFVVGWVFQGLGHHWEGRKPAFFDDLRGLLVGPMFLVAEALWALGHAEPLRRQVEADAGPVRAAR